VVRPLKPARDLAADEATPGAGGDPGARQYQAAGATTPPSWPQSPAHRDARVIQTTTVTWNAQLAQLERRAIRCWQHQPPRELTGELGTPQRNSPCKPASGTRHGDACGCYSGYSEDTTADNVSSPRLSTAAITAKTPKRGLR